MNSVVIRSTPLLGRSCGTTLTFLDMLRTQLDQGHDVSVNDQEIHAFAPVEGLVALISTLIDRPTGKARTFHYGGLTKLTVLEFAKAFAERFGFDPKRVGPSRTVSRPGAHPHPTGFGSRSGKLDYSLNSTQAVEQLKLKPFLLEQCFDLIEQKLVPRA